MRSEPATTVPVAPPVGKCWYRLRCGRSVGSHRARSGLIYRSYDRFIAPVARGVVAAQFWRIEPGRYASVEKKGIVTAEAIAKETSKFMKVDPTLADDEVHPG